MMQVHRVSGGEKSLSNLRQPNEKWLSIPVGFGDTLTLTNLQVEIGTFLKKSLNLLKYFIEHKPLGTQTAPHT